MIILITRTRHYVFFVFVQTKFDSKSFIWQVTLLVELIKSPMKTLYCCNFRGVRSLPYRFWYLHFHHASPTTLSSPSCHTQSGWNRLQLHGWLLVALQCSKFHHPSGHHIDLPMVQLKCGSSHIRHNSASPQYANKICLKECKTKA